MQPPGNIGSETVETSKKGKVSKTVVAPEGAVKARKPKMSWPSERQRLQKLPCPRLLKNLPSY
jgi:hypothetical protein